MAGMHLKLSLDLQNLHLQSSGESRDESSSHFVASEVIGLASLLIDGRSVVESKFMNVIVKGERSLAKDENSNQHS